MESNEDWLEEELNWGLPFEKINDEQMNDFIENDRLAIQRQFNLQQPPSPPTPMEIEAPIQYPPPPPLPPEQLDIELPVQQQQQ